MVKAVSPLCSFSLSPRKWLLSQTPRELLKSPLFLGLLGSNSLVSENHPPLSGTRWLLPSPLCLRGPLRRLGSPDSKGAASNGPLLLKCSRVLLHLPSSSRKFAKWPFLPGKLPRGVQSAASWVSLLSRFWQHPACQTQRPTALVRGCGGWSCRGWSCPGHAAGERDADPHLPGWLMSYDPNISLNSEGKYCSKYSLHKWCESLEAEARYFREHSATYLPGQAKRLTGERQ